VRHVLPWGLLLLIGVGAGLGAALGAAGSPGTAGSSVLAGPEAQQWLTGVLASTKAAGTAHLDSTSVATSPDPDLRQSGTGSGVVNFATRSFRVSETDHTLSWSSENGGPTHVKRETTTDGEIVIGRSDYENFGLPGLRGSWTEQPVQRDEGELGFAFADGFSPVLSALTGPFTAVTVTRLGTATVIGTSTTRYLVQTQIGPSTGAPCPARKGTRQKPLLGRTTVWVDDAGRLVQVRVHSYFSGKVPASFAKQNPSIADQPLGPITYTNTLHFSGFGAPVHIARPALGAERTIFSVPIIGHSSVTCG
jgi:hypothetical protein